MKKRREAGSACRGESCGCLQYPFAAVGANEAAVVRNEAVVGASAAVVNGSVVALGVIESEILLSLCEGPRPLAYRTHRKNDYH